MSAPDELNDLSKRALKFLLDRKVASGWEIARAIGGPDQLKPALQPLLARGYVDYDGDLEDQERTLKSYFNAKPSAFNAAKSAL